MASNAREHITSVEGSTVGIIKENIVKVIEHAEGKLISCFTLIRGDMEALATDLAERLQNTELSNVVDSKLEEEEVTEELAQSLFDNVVSGKAGQEYYIAFNKWRALRNLADKILSEAQTTLGNGPSDFCPRSTAAVKDCLSSIRSIDMSQASVAIANLTAVTSIKRPLQPGETRNVLTNKCLKGFASMNLKPSKGLWHALEKSATQAIFTQFKQSIQGAKGEAKS